MINSNPVSTVEKFMACINSGDLDGALKQYEEDAIFVAEGGTVLKGQESIRIALSELVNIKAKLEAMSHEVISNEDVALFIAKWKMSGVGPDGSSFCQEGISADVLRRQKDNRWLISVDNPYGQEILK